MGMWPQLEPDECHRLHHFHRWQSKQDQAILLGSPWKSDIFAPKKWPKNKLAPAILNDHQQYSRVITGNLRRSSIYSIGWERKIFPCDQLRAFAVFFKWSWNVEMCDLAIFLPNIFVTFLQCDNWCKIVGWWGESVGWQRSQFWCERGSMHPRTVAWLHININMRMVGRSISLQYLVWIDSCSHVCMLKNIHDHCFSSDFQHRPILRGCDRGGHCWLLPSGQTDCPLLGNTTWYYLETPTHWPEKNWIGSVGPSQVPQPTLGSSIYVCRGTWLHLHYHLTSIQNYWEMH